MSEYPTSSSKIISILKSVVDSAGAEWCGVQETIEPDHALLLFNSLKTKSTLAVTFNPSNFDITALTNAVAARLRESDLGFEDRKISVKESTLARISKTASEIVAEVDEFEETQMTTAAKKTLREKLHDVYTQIDFIAKGGENGGGLGYKYTKAVDVVPNVRAALISARVFAEINFDFVDSPYTIARKKEPLAPFAATNVKCFIKFHDLDSDEVLTGSGLGTGGDTGDKAVYKAMTGALKYALKTSFMIPDEAGDDAEADPALDENANSITNVDPTDEPLPDARPEPKADVATAAKTTKPAGVPKAEIPAEPAAAPDSSPAEAAAPTEREPGADESEDMPNDDEMTEFRKKFGKLGDDLTADGKLKSSKNLPVNRKILVFLLNVTKAKDATSITKAQWTDFFQRVEAIKGTEVGIVGLATLVNRANGVEEKKK